MTATTKHAVSRQRAASHTTTERTAPELTPVTEARVRECEESARYWARELGPFAGELGKKADRLAIYSAALSSVTGLAVWSSAIGDENDPYGGIGRNGAQKTPEVETLALLEPTKEYAFKPGRVHNLKADQYISNHGDVRNPAVAHAIVSAVATT